MSLVKLYRFTAALLACPNLRELDLDFATSAFNVSHFSNIVIPHSCHIEALRIASSSSSASPAILRVFPSLKFVEFKSPVTFHVPQGSPPTCKLTELHWLGPVHDCLLWVLRNSVGSLEILSLPSCRLSLMYDEDQFEYLMSTYGPSLRSLHIPSLPDSQMASLRHCVKLEELILGGMPSEMILGKLPETIEHLQIQFTDDEQLVGYSNSVFSYFARFIETAPSLLTLTWVHEAAPIISGLQELCERRGIIWRGWTQPYGMYPGEVCHSSCYIHQCTILSEACSDKNLNMSRHFPERSRRHRCVQETLHPRTWCKKLVEITSVHFYRFLLLERTWSSPTRHFDMSCRWGSYKPYLTTVGRAMALIQG